MICRLFFFCYNSTYQLKVLQTEYNTPFKWSTIPLLRSAIPLLRSTIPLLRSELSISGSSILLLRSTIPLLRSTIPLLNNYEIFLFVSNNDSKNIDNIVVCALYSLLNHAHKKKKIFFSTKFAQIKKGVQYPLYGAQHPF
jgi:hypothetical protein